MKKSPKESREDIEARVKTRATTLLASLPPDSDIDAHSKQWLAECRAAIEGGVVGSVKDVVRFYCDKRRALPIWIVPIVLDWLEKAESTERRLRKQHDTDMIDFKRWRTVRDMREQHRCSKIAAVALAAEYLTGTAAGMVGRDAVERSYKRVQRTMKKNPERYHLTSDWLLAGPDGPNRAG